MSMTATSVVNEAQDIKARSAAATRAICEALQLGVVPPKNLQYLTVALTEVVTNEIVHNRALGEQIRTQYETLIPPPKSKSTRSKSYDYSGVSGAQPRSRGNAKPSPNDPIDFEFLAQHFSREEVSDKLKNYSMEPLKKAAALVQRQHPGTKPTTLAKKDALVAYLLEYAF